MKPPGNPERNMHAPNNTDTLSEASASKPASENTSTIAPSRMPQPANEIGIMLRSSTGGNRNTAAASDKFSDMERAKYSTTSPSTTWLMSDSRTVAVNRGCKRVAERPNESVQYHQQ